MSGGEGGEGDDRRRSRDIDIDIWRESQEPNVGDRALKTCQGQEPGSQVAGQ